MVLSKSSRTAAYAAVLSFFLPPLIGGIFTAESGLVAAALAFGFSATFLPAAALFVEFVLPNPTEVLHFIFASFMGICSCLVSSLLCYPLESLFLRDVPSIITTAASSSNSVSTSPSLRSLAIFLFVHVVVLNVTRITYCLSHVLVVANAVPFKKNGWISTGIGFHAPIIMLFYLPIWKVRLFPQVLPSMALDVIETGGCPRSLSLIYLGICGLAMTFFSVVCTYWTYKAAHALSRRRNSYLPYFSFFLVFGVHSIVAELSLLPHLCDWGCVCGIVVFVILGAAGGLSLPFMKIEDYGNRLDPAITQETEQRG